MMNQGSRRAIDGKYPRAPAHVRAVAALQEPRVWPACNESVTMARTALAAILLVLALTTCSPGGSVSASKCGEWPLPQSSGAKTPAVATAVAIATATPAVVIGAWSDCFRPESADVRPGQLVQWQAAEAGITPELVVDDGGSLGRIQHLLEFRFLQPGTYRYHVRNSPQVSGTIVVR